MIFGDKSIFAIEYFGSSGGLDIADIYIGGVNITDFDNSHYKLSYNLERQAKYFIDRVNWFEHDYELPKDSVEERFYYISDGNLRIEYRVLDLGPPTDGCYVAVVPFRNRLYLCRNLNGKADLMAVEIKPFNMATIMLDLNKYITSLSS